MTKKRLGMGLGALLGEKNELGPQNKLARSRSQENKEAVASNSDTVCIKVPIENIAPNRYQPRGNFSEEEIVSLGESIRIHGLMQPIMIRKVGSSWELIAGERRLRACKYIGLKEIEAYVQEVEGKKAAEMALVENIQRTDLNPIERARAYKKLNEEFGLTHAEIGTSMSTARSSISNHIRLLDSTKCTQDLLEKGLISLGHAKVLMLINDPKEQENTAQRIVKEAWSVRQLEKNINSGKPKKEESGVFRTPIQIQSDSLATDLGEYLGTKISIKCTGKNKGYLKVEYYDLDQLEGLFQKIGFKPST